MKKIIFLAKAEDKNKNSITNDKNITYSKTMFSAFINVFLIITNPHSVVQRNHLSSSYCSLKDIAEG